MPWSSATVARSAMPAGGASPTISNLFALVKFYQGRRRSAGIKPIVGCATCCVEHAGQPGQCAHAAVYWCATRTGLPQPDHG
jgi:DNA polymerase III alpha subunit